MKLRYVVLLFPLTLLMFLTVPAQLAVSEKSTLYKRAKLVKDSYSSVAISPHGDYFAFGKEGLFRLMDYKALGCEFSLERSPMVYASVFSQGKGNMKLALGLSDGTILLQSASYLWDKNTMQTDSILHGHESPIYAVAFCADGRTLASGGKDGAIMLWDALKKEYLFTLQGHIKAVNSIAFSPDGQLLASGTSDGKVRLWHLLTQKELTVLQGHVGSINAVAFSPDGQTLASGGKDGKIKLWDISKPRESGKREPVLLGEHISSVNVVAFSPDKRTLASGGEDKVLLWDIQTGQKIDPINHYIEEYKESEIYDFSGLIEMKHKTAILSLAFSSSGQKLISGDDSGSILFWDLPKIGIMPDRDELFYASVPEPLIEQLKQFDKEGPEITASNPADVGELRVDSTQEAAPDTTKVQPSEQPATSAPPIADDVEKVPANSGNVSQKADTPESTSEGVKIEMHDPDIESEGEQGKPDRAYHTAEEYCFIFGKVNGLESGFIKAEVKNKRGKADDIIQEIEDGVFRFRQNVKLSAGDNEITLTVLGTKVSKTFVIERIRDSQLPDRPIQPPNRPIESPPPVPPPKQDTQPPTLEVNIEDRSQKGTTNADWSVREVPTPDGSNVKGKAFEVSSEIAHFQVRVTDDTSKSHNITLKSQINDKDSSFEADGSGSFSCAYDLKYGKNEIIITATDESGKRTQKEYTVYHRPNREGKDLALFFATENYQFYPEESNKNWRNLNTPIADADKIAQNLRENYGFKTKIFKNLTKRDMEEKINAYRFDFKDEGETVHKYHDDSQLLIYFTGHGYYHKDPDDRKPAISLIAARDSVQPMISNNALSNKLEVIRTSLEFDDIRGTIEKFECNNIFVLLDTCQSGSFDPKFKPLPASKGPPPPEAREGLLAWIKNRINLKAKWFMTAASAQYVSDGAITVDGEVVGSSPFAEAFMKALDTKGKGLDTKGKKRSGFLTVDDVWQFIDNSKNHEVYTKKEYKTLFPEPPKPREGQFGNSENGDFLFFPVVPRRE